MQTTNDTIISAGTQTPLLKAEQLEPGLLITGIAMSHIWEILMVDPTHVFIRKVEGPESCVDDMHNMGVYGRGQVCSRCQARRQETKEFLPLKPDKARVHIIQPMDKGAQKPEPFTVYGGMKKSGEVALYYLHPNGQWNTALPPFPALVRVWSIPESLRIMVKEGVPGTDWPVNPTPI